MSWRRCPFRVAGLYRVLKTFDSAGSHFSAGDVVRFERESYSRYDAATVYEFVSESRTEPLQWWFADNEPDEKPSELFLLI